MGQDLTGSFRFKLEGLNVFDLTDLTRQVFNKILLVYVNLFFIEVSAQKFILLKEDVKMDELNEQTKQLINLAKAAHLHIRLRINH